MEWRNKSMQINIQLNADYVYEFGRNIDNYHFRWVMGEFCKYRSA